MLDQIFGEILKHRRVLITNLDNPNENVIQAIHRELLSTDELTKQIKEAAEDLKNRINGKTKTS